MPILLIVLFAIVVSNPAIAACNDLARAHINLITAASPVDTETKFTLEQPADVADGTGEAQNRTPPGFHVSRLVERVDVEVEPWTSGGCLGRNGITLHLDPTNRRIEIAEDTFASYVNWMSVGPQTKALPEAIMKESTTAIQDSMQERLQSIAGESLPRFHASRVAALEAVEEEMGRGSEALYQ